MKQAAIRIVRIKSSLLCTLAPSIISTKFILGHNCTTHGKAYSVSECQSKKKAPALSHQLGQTDASHSMESACLLSVENLRGDFK